MRNPRGWLKPADPPDRHDHLTEFPTPSDHDRFDAAMLAIVLALGMIGL